MLNTSLILDREREVRLHQERLLQERPVPGRSWFRRLVRLVRPGRVVPPPEEGAEFLVSDDRPALLLVEGRPARRLEPGRHRMVRTVPHAEIRLLTPEAGAVEGLDETGLRALPFERAFHFLDGSLVGILVSGPARERPLRRREPAEARPLRRTVPGEDEDAIRDFSFV